MPLNPKLIPGLIEDLKYNYDLVKKLVKEHYGEKTVNEETFKALLTSFLNEENDAIEKESGPARKKTDSFFNSRLARQAEAKENKEVGKKQFDIKEYNRVLSADIGAPVLDAVSSGKAYSMLAKDLNTSARRN